MPFSKKQIEFFENADHRWNVKVGATRSGKTYMDYYVIPKRIRARVGMEGHSAILGVSRGTIQRNIIEPLQGIWGANLVGDISSSNICHMFGEDVYCLGAEKVSQVSKLRGSSLKYCYGDEVAEWNPDVFQMLKSRLDKPYSCFDGACNPDAPQHWFKEFLESDVDVYCQKYEIFDNPFLDPKFVEELCKEYEGTIYYDRYILGLWKRAEGAIYRKFADNPGSFVIQVNPAELSEITIGIDFGGNQSGHAFVARGYTKRYQKVIGLMSRRILQKDYKEPIDSNVLDSLVLDFIADVEKKYGSVDEVYWDNAESVLGAGIRNAVELRFPHIIVRPAKKIRIKDRIDCTVRLMGAGRFFITEDCESLSKALEEAVWDKESLLDERLDDGSSDIDSLDAFEYAIERDIKYLIGG